MDGICLFFEADVAIFRSNKSTSIHEMCKLVCPRDRIVIQLQTKSVLKGHVVVHQSSRLYAGHISGVSIDFSIERRFDTPNRFQSNELSHLAIISARPIIYKMDLLLRKMTSVDYRTPEQSTVKVKHESIYPE